MKIYRCNLRDFPEAILYCFQVGNDIHAIGEFCSHFKNGYKIEKINDCIDNCQYLFNDGDKLINVIVSANDFLIFKDDSSFCHRTEAQFHRLYNIMNEVENPNDLFEITEDEAINRENEKIREILNYHGIDTIEKLDEVLNNYEKIINIVDRRNW